MLDFSAFRRPYPKITSTPTFFNIVPKKLDWIEVGVRRFCLSVARGKYDLIFPYERLPKTLVADVRDGYRDYLERHGEVPVVRIRQVSMNDHRHGMKPFRMYDVSFNEF